MQLVKNGPNIPVLQELPIPPGEGSQKKHLATKDDQLMALCNQLEQQLTTSYDQAEKLIAATTKALVA